MKLVYIWFFFTCLLSHAGSLTCTDASQERDLNTVSWATATNSYINAGSPAWNVGLPLLDGPLGLTGAALRVSSYVRNTSNPWKDLQGFTAVDVSGTGTDHQNNCTVIAPRVVMGQSHLSVSALNFEDTVDLALTRTFIFCDRNNNVTEIGVIGSRELTNSIATKTGLDGTKYPDMRVYLLAESVPVGIDIARVATVDQQAIQLDNFYPVLGKRARDHIAVPTSPQTQLSPAFQQFALLSARTNGLGGWLWVSTSGAWETYAITLPAGLTNYTYNVAGGDSGSGGFWLLDNELVFAGLSGGVHNIFHLTFDDMVTQIGNMFSNSGVSYTDDQKPKAFPYRLYK